MCVLLLKERKEGGREGEKGREPEDRLNICAQ